MTREDDFFPDINEYLTSNNDNSPIEIKNLEELILKVRSKTGLSKEKCSILVKEFFQQIRNEMLRNNLILIRDFGKFFISEKGTIRFKNAKNVKEKLNG